MMNFQQIHERQDKILNCIKESGDKGVTAKEITKKIGVKDVTNIIFSFKPETMIYEEDDQKTGKPRYFWFKG